MKTILVTTILSISFLMSCKTSKSELNDHSFLFIKNATILDVNNLGKTKNDQVNKCILIKDDQIYWIKDDGDKINLPPKAKTIDAKGKYIIPGLIDGFGALNKQSYCNAYLYMGITSIIAVDGGRRGVFYAQGKPSPNTYRLEGLGDKKIKTDSMLYQLKEYHDKGYKVMLLMYGLTPKQLEIAIKKSHQYGMATIGELGYTSYKEGMELGLNAIVHTTRYSLDIAPKDMALKVADQPFSNDLNSPKWKYYKYLTQLKKNDPQLIKNAEQIGKSNSFILPTSSLSYLDLPDHKNPWNEKISSILTIEDINRPADPITGNHSIDSTEQAAYTNLITNELTTIEPTYHQHGAKYLTGSGTDVWGTMPGISLHTELSILHNKIGLTKREVIAAATSNFSDAFGWKNGKIKIGYKANLLILNKNPFQNLEYLKDINTLILNGKIIDRNLLLVK